MGRDAATTARPTAYAALASRLRGEIVGHRYPDGTALPTEAELSRQHGVSRQTVRRAFQDLVAEGIVYRVPGRGTFAVNDDGRYLRSSGSIEDLLALALDTQLEIVEPPAVRVDLEAAGRLGLDRDDVVALRFRRHHRGNPYCVTSAYLPVALGQGLFDVPELGQVGVLHQMTVLSVVQAVAGTPIAGADQSITAVAATHPVAGDLGCRVGAPLLRIDRIYFDRDRRRLELAVNHFDPNRYSYRFQMRAAISR